MTGCVQSTHLPARDRQSREPGFGIYVHWPFCASKCPYCDFNSHVRMGGVDEARFRDALTRELGFMAALAPGRTVTSIYFGGGTPSLMSAGSVAAVLDHIGKLWRLGEDVETTIEANPSSVEVDRFRGYRTAGVNRVSLGVQALDDGALKVLGRLHSVAEARHAIAIAGRTFERTSFDLIYARPGQTADAWRRELSEALAMADEHLSLYQLTIEDGTPFATLHRAGRLIVPPHDLSDHLYEMTAELTAAAGLPAYEVSNHARPGAESRHNLTYWRYGEYAGVGPGAHGRLIVNGARHALQTEKNPEAWATAVERQGHGLVEDLVLTAVEQAHEMLLMGLRLSEGLDLDRLVSLGPFRPSAVAIRRLCDLGMLEVPAVGRIAATRRGRFVLNELIRQLARDW